MGVGDIVFRSLTLFVLIIGVVIPVLKATTTIIIVADQIKTVLRNYPPHLHIDGMIYYPKDYAPPASRRDD